MNLPDDHISAELILPAPAARAFVSNREVQFTEELDSALDVASGESAKAQHAKYVVIRVVP